MSNPSGTNKLGYNGGRSYSFLNRPVLIDCNFVIDSLNGNGLGIRNLKGSGVQNVYMNVAGTGLPAGSPALGTARSYAILGASTVTNTGNSVLTGNLGLTPGSSITGFPPGTFTGQEHVDDVAVAAAKASAQAVYTALQAKSPTGISSVLNGQTLAGGVYKATSGTAGAFTLDAATGALVLSGSATDIYVFQTTTTLITGTTGAGAITLGNVLPQNIYWVVGSSVTLNSGTASPFYGNVIAQTDITSTTTGGAISGSLIALTGAVTLSAATTITAQVPAAAPVGANPNPLPGYALIQLANNYNRYSGGFSGFVSPLNSSNIAINSTALTVGQPYVIVSVGHAALGTVTVATVADSAGSLASTWFRLFDAYGNTFIVWFSVNGVGAAPMNVAGTPVQVQLVSNESAANVGAKLVIVLNALLATQILNPSGPAGVYSFTTSGTTTVTIVSTATNPYGPLPGAPSEGLVATGFTFANTVYTTNLQDWQAVGVPKGVVPVIGVSFIAKATGYTTGGASTGLVRTPAVSGINSIEVIGDPNASLAPIPMGGSPNVGGWIMVQMLSNGVPIAPLDNSVCGMSFLVEAASVMIAGE